MEIFMFENLPSALRDADLILNFGATRNTRVQGVVALLSLHLKTWTNLPI